MKQNNLGRYEDFVNLKAGHLLDKHQVFREMLEWVVCKNSPLSIHSCKNGIIQEIISCTEKLKHLHFTAR
jgi:hypothetical protein